MTPKTLKIYVVEAISGNFMYTSCPIVDFRSAVWLPYDHRSVANTDTRCTPNILGGSLIRFLAPKLEDIIIVVINVAEFASSDIASQLN